MAIKAFRLFVSSTFADFAQERDVLQREVFPKLDTYCTARGYQFFPLDLRWGVSEEAQLDQRTAEICLSEVHAVRAYPPPNFLIMIGNRYGLVPLPYAIAQDEFEAILKWLEDHDRHGEAEALAALYVHDGNHLIPRGLLGPAIESDPLTSAHTLRSRTDELSELRPAEAWAKKEAELRSALQAAADGLLALGQIGEEGHEKYFLSLTEQEIMHGLQWRGRGPAVPLSQGDPPPAIAFIREIVGTPAAMPGFVESTPRLDGLKDRLKRALPADRIVTLQGAFDRSGKLGEAYLAHFAAQIQAKLGQAIDRHIIQAEAVERAPDFALASERAQHRAFGAARLKVFVGRESNLEAIAQYLAGASNQPLVLHGRSGAGKSALIARAAEDAENAGTAPPRSLFMSLVEELASHGVVSMPEEFEEDASKFNDQIAALLSSAGRALVFLDALDQWQKPQTLGWLPTKLPAQLRLVLSVLNDPAYESDSGLYRNLRQRFALSAFLEIEPLSPAQGREILAVLERDSLHRLQNDQRDYVIERFNAADASPLYLTTAFEITRSWKSFNQAGEGRYCLAADTAGIIAQYIAELSSVHHHEPELVARTLGFLAAAREGLSEKELTEILSRDQGVMRSVSSEIHGARTDRLPPSVWVRLNRDLAPFLVEKLISDQPLLHFFHRQVAEVARRHHYEPFRTGLHAALADYFGCQTGERDGGEIYGPRSLSELPFQLHGAGRKPELDRILQSPNWIGQKFAAFGPQRLLSDYEQFARGALQTKIGRTLRLISGICARDKGQLFPQLHGRLMSDEAAAPFCASARALTRGPALLTSCPSLTPPGAELARLECPGGEVKALQVLPDGRLASGSYDDTIRLWDTNTGTELARLEGHRGWVRALATNTRQELARLEGHDGEVKALTVLADGRLASASFDRTVRLWNTDTGEELARLEGHGDIVWTLAALPDGRLASGSGDKTVRLWDAITGKEQARLEGHGDRVYALIVLSDGSLASGSFDATIRIWDTKTCKEQARLDGGGGPVWELAALPDNRLAAGYSNSIGIWDVNTRSLLTSLKGHDGSVDALAALPDGRLASGSFDKTIRLWEIKPADGLVMPHGHDDLVKGLAVLRDGRLASGSYDRSLRLWDPETGAELSRIDHDGVEVTALVTLPDGRLASGSFDKTIRLWAADSGAKVSQIKVFEGSVSALAALNDGRLVSSASDVIGLWNISTGNRVARFEAQGDFIKVLTVLPDGRIAFDSHNTIRIWDVKTSEQPLGLYSHDHNITALAALPDDRLASGSSDDTIRIWDTKTGINTKTLKGHKGTVNALAVLQDGRLISGSSDGTVRVWDTNTGAQITRLDVDASIQCLTVRHMDEVVAGDTLGRLYWLKVLDKDGTDLALPKGPPCAGNQLLDNPEGQRERNTNPVQNTYGKDAQTKPRPSVMARLFANLLRGPAS